MRCSVCLEDVHFQRGCACTRKNSVMRELVDKAVIAPSSISKKEESKQSALATQEGGGHYKSMPIQPVEFITKNKIPYCEANAIKYLCRWRGKNGLEDLKKAKHYIDLLIELEGAE